MTTLLTELAVTTRRIAAHVDPAIVTIGRRGRGTGFVIGDHRVLTNAHNLRDRTTAVTFADGRSVQGQVHGADIDGDLVVLEVDTGDVASLEWADAEPQLGDAVFAASRGPAGIRVTSGQATNIGRDFRGPRGRRIPGGIEHNARLARGSSGGPLLDPDGKVLGVNTHRLGAGFYLARSADERLTERIGSLASGAVIERPRLGIAIAGPDVAAKLRASVGLPERTGLLVRNVEEGSPAADAGVTVGDLLVAAAGTDLASTDDLFDALDRADTELTISLVRGADEMTVTVHFPAAGDGSTDDTTDA